MLGAVSLSLLAGRSFKIEAIRAGMLRRRLVPCFNGDMATKHIVRPAANYNLRQYKSAYGAPCLRCARRCTTRLSRLKDVETLLGKTAILVGNQRGEALSRFARPSPKQQRLLGRWPCFVVAGLPAAQAG